MSLSSWKKEFYPVPATKSKSFELQAAEHSLLKWTGLLPKNLKKHELTIDFWGDLQGKTGSFKINASTCALCQRHVLRRNLLCGTCIINEKFIQCDHPDSAYRRWRDDRNPKPMINVLKKCVKILKERK